MLYLIGLGLGSEKDITVQGTQIFIIIFNLRIGICQTSSQGLFGVLHISISKPKRKTGLHFLLVASDELLGSLLWQRSLTC